MRWRADLGVAAALLVAAEVELLVREDLADLGLRMALAGVACAAVALRRRRPLPAMLVCSACFSGLSFAGLAIETTAEVIAFLVLVFSVAEQLSLRAATIGLVVAAAGILLEAAGQQRLDDVVFVVVVFLIPPWLLGRAARDRVRRLAELERLGRALATEHERAQALAAEAERARIAREMHDVLSHSVGLIALQAGAGERLAASDPTAARETLHTIAAAGRSALEELGGVLEENEAVPDLERMVEGIRAAGLDVELRHEAAAPPPPDVALATRRIVQEALTNVVKHAAARRVVVEVRETPEAVDLRVTDDGTGEGPGGGTGRGLVGMRERAAVYNGDLRAGPHAEGGFAVEARLRVGSA